jgi:hypothetical protein
VRRQAKAYERAPGEAKLNLLVRSWRDYQNYNRVRMIEFMWATVAALSFYFFAVVSPASSRYDVVALDSVKMITLALAFLPLVCVAFFLSFPSYSSTYEFLCDKLAQWNGSANDELATMISGAYEQVSDRQSLVLHLKRLVLSAPSGFWIIEFILIPIYASRQPCDSVERLLPTAIAGFIKSLVGCS